ncbi:MAG TPA: hypothetical protein VGZ27_08440 [Vicinamibacterales bacterium]|jgi:type II secretory ATPase GspE/PulE/Tfp pilus assembly ATPase PilB-like protein|nr:hypothetical protein [Vicinamibacterales bacterium]
MSSSVLGIVAQRLVRRICSTCRTEVPTPSGLRHLFREGEPDTFYRGEGRKDCRGTGFRGRIGIVELLEMTKEMTELVLSRAPEAQGLGRRDDPGRSPPRHTGRAMTPCFSAAR